MPAASTAASRRRELGSRLGHGIRAEQYHLVERWEGFRIEHPLRHVVDLRFSRREIELTSETRRAVVPIFMPLVLLSRRVAAMLLDLPEGSAGADGEAIRRESWMVARVMRPMRRRLFDRHHAEASQVEELMLTLRGVVPRLACAPLLYRTPFLVRDVLRYRAAAIALAFVATDLWPEPPVEGSLPTVAHLRRLMRTWRSLFSPTGVSYRSLDRTLMNLPAGIAPRRLCELRHVRLERPITNRLELQFLLEVIALTRERGRPRPELLRMAMHASEATVRAALRHIADATCPLDPSDANHVARAVYYLLDAPPQGSTRLDHAARHAVRWHRMLHRHLRAVAAGIPFPLAGEHPPETPTARPPVPLPAAAGVQFLDTVGAVIEESRRMQHCIALYADCAVAGRCYLFHVEHAGESASIEVGADGTLQQAAGPRNRRNRATEWGRRELARWAAAWRGTRR